MAGVALPVAVGAGALLRGASAFVPGTAGVRGSAPASWTQPAGAQRSEQGGEFAAKAATGLLAVAAAAVGGAAVRRAAPRRSQVAASAVRRDLAVAYEDSGIDLLDNGQFAQGLVGAEGAWGRYEFDPAGFSRYTEFVPWFREAELKHGRICMLAWLGLVAPDFVRIPGERYSFEAIPCVLDAHDRLNGSVGVNVQILIWISVVELCCAKKVFEWNSVECAGDYNFGIQFLPKDEEGQKRLRLAELKNGRLAMIGFGGAVTQAVLTHNPFPWLY